MESKEKIKEVGHLISQFVVVCISVGLFIYSIVRSYQISYMYLALVGVGITLSVILIGLFVKQVSNFVRRGKDIEDYQAINL